jgi:hypothetical protein
VKSIEGKGDRVAIEHPVLVKEVRDVLSLV